MTATPLLLEIVIYVRFAARALWTMLYPSEPSRGSLISLPSSATVSSTWPGLVRDAFTAIVPQSATGKHI